MYLQTPVLSQRRNVCWRAAQRGRTTALALAPHHARAWYVPALPAKGGGTRLPIHAACTRAALKHIHLPLNSKNCACGDALALQRTGDWADARFATRAPACLLRCTGWRARKTRGALRLPYINRTCIPHAYYCFTAFSLLLLPGSRMPANYPAYLPVFLRGGVSIQLLHRMA